MHPRGATRPGRPGDGVNRFEGHLFCLNEQKRLRRSIRDVFDTDPGVRQEDTVVRLVLRAMERSGAATGVGAARAASRYRQVIREYIGR